MEKRTAHTFHIPVMGLGFTIDTPVKVARFGISSVISIIEDELIESMREVHCIKSNEEYIPITRNEKGHRAKRITAYLDLIQRIVDKQVIEISCQEFNGENDIDLYFQMLDDNNPAKAEYYRMIAEERHDEKNKLQAFLREQICPGDIDVNIMTKVDRAAYDEKGERIESERSDAQTALKGFAESRLSSSVVFSAGMNPALYSYCAEFADFFPDAMGTIKKRIILKVSDFRSAQIQGKFLAKKGLWISEFRIESGLNCGGHAFAADGLLLGPVLEEFRSKRAELKAELFEICSRALAAKSIFSLPEESTQRITVQGGIGNAGEDRFLREYYGLDGTGWGSPFLLVPEATNVDAETLDKLATASREDYYLSDFSPLGIPLNNFRKSSSEEQRQERIRKGRPGSPCRKKYLAFNSEAPGEPICVASREYQQKALEDLSHNPGKQNDLAAIRKIEDKECLCEGLGAAALIANNAIHKLRLKAVAICPGPNLGYFNGKFSLRQMIAHIYGKEPIRLKSERPHMFVHELQLNIDYLKKLIGEEGRKIDSKAAKSLQEFSQNLLSGIIYYLDRIGSFCEGGEHAVIEMKRSFITMFDVIRNMVGDSALNGKCGTVQ